MARKKRELTPLQQEYYHERNRIIQFMYRARKRGYEFKPKTLPKIPDQIRRRSVEALKKLTPEKLYQKAEYGGEATLGEVVKGTAGRKAERKQAAERAKETRRLKKIAETYVEEPSYEPDYFDYDYDYDYYDEPPTSDIEVPDTVNEEANFYENTIINMYREQLQWYNQDASRKLLNWVHAVIESQGRKAVAKMIQHAQEAGIGLTRQEAYSEAKVTEYIGRMMDYLPEAGDFTKQEIMDALEYEENYEAPA